MKRQFHYLFSVEICSKPNSRFENSLSSMLIQNSHWPRANARNVDSLFNLTLVNSFIRHKFFRLVRESLWKVASSPFYFLQWFPNAAVVPQRFWRLASDGSASDRALNQISCTLPRNGVARQNVRKTAVSSRWHDSGLSGYE